MSDNSDVLILIGFLCWAGATACVLHFARDRFFQDTFRRHWIGLILLVGVTILWRLPHTGRFFLGLEYEDSYVYTVVGRQLTLHLAPSTQGMSPYLTTVCAVGSLENCRAFETYSGHYLGSPFLIATVSNLLGYRPDIASVIAVLAACLVVVAVFHMARILTDSLAASFGGAIVFAITPVFSVHGTGAFAEPISNAFVCLCVLLLLNFVKSRPTDPLSHGILNVVAFSLVTTFAVLIKRENLLIALWAALVAVFMMLRPGSRPLRPWLLLAPATLVVWFSLTGIGLPAAIVSEAAEYDGFPFSFGGLAVMLPQFLAAFSNANWFSIGGIFVLVGIGSSVYRRNLGALLAFIATSYIVLYSSHVRSYYALVFADVSPFDALRYSMNVMGLWGVLAGLGVSTLVQGIGSRLTRGRTRFVSASSWVLVGILVVHSFWATRQLREDMVTEEFLSRVAPAITSSQIAFQLGPDRSYIVTLEPLLIQIYSPPSTRVLDLNVVNSELLDSLLSDGADLIFVEHRQYENRVGQGRYRRQLELMDGLAATTIHEDEKFTIKRLIKRPRP